MSCQEGKRDSQDDDAESRKVRHITHTHTLAFLNIQISQHPREEPKDKKDEDQKNSSATEHALSFILGNHGYMTVILKVIQHTMQG